MTDRPHSPSNAPPRVTEPAGRRLFVVALVVGIGLGLSVAAYFGVRDWQDANLQVEFQRRAENQAKVLQRQLASTFGALGELSGIYRASGGITPEAFRVMTGRELVEERGTLSLGWVPRVSAPGPEAGDAPPERFVATNRPLAGSTLFAQSTEPGFGNDRLPLRYIEFVGGGGIALGIDLALDRSLRDILGRARDRGNAVATERFNIGDDAGEEAGIMAFEPVYASGTRPGLLQQRKTDLVGFFVAVYSLHDIVKAAIRQTDSAGLDIYLFDDSAKPKNRLLYFHASHESIVSTEPLSEEMARTGRFRETGLAAPGRRWSVLFRATPGFYAQRRTWSAYAAPALGMLVTFMLATYLLVLGRRAVQIENLAVQLSAANTALETEISEREGAHLALRENQQILRAIIDSVPAMISAKDRESRYILMNRYQAELYGVAKDQVAGVTATDLLGEDYGAYTAGIDKRVVDTGEAVPFYDEESADAAGVMHAWLTTKIPLKDASGRVTSVVTVALDVSERKRAEEALRTSESTFRQLVETANVIPWEIDLATWQFIYVGPQAVGVLGYPLEEWYSEKFWPKHLHPDDREWAIDFCRCATARSEDHEFEYRMLAADGSVVWLRDYVTVVQGEGGPEKLRGFLFDCTDQKRAQLEIIAAKEQAELANRTKSEFLANMSHELRTPLNAIIGFSDLMKQQVLGPVSNEKYVDYAKDINESGAHLLELINDILDLSKVEAGKLDLHEEILDVRHIFRSCLRLIKERAETGGLTLDVRVPEAIPQLRADPRKLKQILLNLLSNAVKFTPAGGTITLQAAAGPRRGFVIKVIDTGIGILAEDIPKAMAAFGQVDGTLSRKYEGTGLGVSLTKSLVELHGGSFELESELDAGTTAIIRFPAKRIVKLDQTPHSAAS